MGKNLVRPTLRCMVWHDITKKLYGSVHGYYLPSRSAASGLPVVSGACFVEIFSCFVCLFVPPDNP